MLIGPSWNFSSIVQINLVLGLGLRKKKRVVKDFLDKEVTNILMF